MTATVERGREAFARQAWDEAHRELSRVVGAELDLDDLERLATAAYLAGDQTATQRWHQAYRGCLRRGQGARAARCAFWLAQGLFNRGEFALGAGWLARAAEAVGDLDCVERGYLMIPRAIQSFERGEVAEALARFEDAAGLAQRFGDADLAAFAGMGRGQALIALGDYARATTALDAAMVAVCAGEVSPMVAGLVYCGAIEACQAMADLRRAVEWTGALSRWCDEQPALVPYRGQCLVHRAEIMELRGDWDRGLAEARDACERLADDLAVGNAHYQLGELHRLRGEVAEAESAYRAASQAGRQPQPGLALLRLDQGQVAAAEAAIRRAADETTGAVARCRVLSASVEIALAVDDVARAQVAADELHKIATEVGAAVLHAYAAHAHGALMLAEGTASAALPVLRDAWTRWRRLEVPYQAARVRVLLGLGCRALGDTDGADMEFDAARLGLEQLGARAELGRLDRMIGTGGRQRNGGLTDRELEVLALVARGLTNRQIGSALVVSEHTVARHLQNIFTKLGVSSRTAASTYAKEQSLL